MAYIYQIVNDINQKVYVGKTDFSIEKRFREHCKDAFKERNENRPLYRAMLKYGIEHFHVELLEETDDPEEREIYWIKAKDSYRNGYNATLGGDGKRRYNHEEILKRLREYPYPSAVAKEFGCSVDIVRDIAKQNNIQVRNKDRDDKAKAVMQLDKEGNFLARFDSVSEAARWCYHEGKCKALATGVGQHIADCAKGRRKTAYGYKWEFPKD